MIMPFGKYDQGSRMLSKWSSNAKQEDDSFPLRNLPRERQKKLKTGSDFEKPKKNSNFAALNLQRTGLVAQLDRATAF